MRSTIDRPSPSPRATLRALVEPLELAEHGLLLRLRDAEAGVADLDRAARAAPPAADQHAALGVYLMRVGDEVLQQPAQQPPVRANRQRATA